jgi:hypothetical protein
MTQLFGAIGSIHAIFGERVLPVLILLTAIFLTVTYRPGAGRSPVARIFPILVDIQVTLGILYWIYLLFSTSGPTQAQYLSFPFILHPILGVLAVGLAHMAVGKRNRLANLGRWAPLASLSALLGLVLVNITIASMN